MEGDRPSTSNSLPALVVHATRIKARVGRAMDGVVVGAFSDAALGTAGDFQARIDWGDTPVPGLLGDTPGGTIRGVHLLGERDGPAVRLYLVTGAHTYQQAGTFPIAVTITAADGRVAYLTSIAQVSRPLVGRRRGPAGQGL